MAFTEILLYGPRGRSTDWLQHAAYQWSWPGDAVTAATCLLRADLMDPIKHAEVEVVWVPQSRAYFRMWVVDYVNNGEPVNPIALLNPELTSPDWANPVSARQDITALFESWRQSMCGQIDNRYLAWQLHGYLLLAKAAIYLWS